MNRRVLLSVILAVAGFYRFYALPTVPPGLWRDEGADGADALTALETRHFSVFYPDDNGREGLYINLAALGIGLFGASVWVLRLPAALFGFLTIPGIYLLGSELFSVPIGLLAAFFTATSFWHINFSRIAFRAIAAPFFLVWAVYLLLTAFRRLREGKSYLARMVLAGVVYGLGFHTYIAYRVTPLLIGLVLLHEYFLARSERRSRNFRYAAAAFLIAAVLTVAPLAIYFVRHPGTFDGRMDTVSAWSYPHAARTIAGNFIKTMGMLYISGDANWRHNDSTRPEVYWPVAACLTIGLVAAFGRLVGRRDDEKRMPGAVVLVWLLLGAAPAFLSSEGVPHAMRSILMIPAVFLLAATGAWSVYERLSRSAHGMALPIAGTAVLLALTCQVGYAYFFRWAENPMVSFFFDIGLKNMARDINASPRDLPKIVAVEAYDAASFEGLPIRVTSVMYLTRTISERDREQAHVKYYTRDTFEIPIPPEMYGRDFCAQVAAAMMTSRARVFCMR